MSGSHADRRIVPSLSPGNEQLLRVLAREHWDKVLVTSFTRDPADPNPELRADWSAWPAGQVLNNPLFDEGNTYYCPALLKPGRRTLAASRFDSLPVLTFDDIGQKVPLARVVALLGCEPTYIIETSPGSFQAGWRLDPPPTDLAWVKGMLAQLDRALTEAGGSTDNLTNPIAWRRLPVGWNTKASLAAPWRVRLVHFRPDCAIRGVDHWMEIEERIGPIVRMTTLDRGMGNGHRPDADVLAADPVYRALEAGGMVVGEKLTADKHWAATIRCPWIAGHGPRRPLEGAEYVPAMQGQAGWFHCFHCERRGQGEFRTELDVALRAEGVPIVAVYEFDVVDPATVAAPGEGEEAVGPSGGALDLWEETPPPAWPGGVLPGVLEDLLADLAERDGLDLGALGATMVTAASGAADKRVLLTPYAGSLWQVRAVLWLMLVAETGQRKTAVLRHPLDRLRKLNAERMQQYARAMGIWRARPPAQKQQPAPTVRGLLAEDATVETLQMWMADNPRGMLYLRDELAALFDFGRYSPGGGAAERGFFLETYEGGPTTIGRMTRTTTIANCALAIIGGIQPHRLADFKGLQDDGLLSRFNTVIQQATGLGVRRAAPPDIAPINEAMDRLLVRGAVEDYRTDAEGERLIQETEELGQALAQQPGIATGFRGAIQKLHGVHARTALVLHLLDGGEGQVVPAETVERAGRYARFVFGHSRVFYGGLADSPVQVARAIGSYILRQPLDRVTAGQLRWNVAACRGLRSLREIQDAVFLLVMGGWLQAETNFPSNHAWRVRRGLREQFAGRLASETDRVDAVKSAMNHLGRYR